MHAIIYYTQPLTLRIRISNVCDVNDNVICRGKVLLIT
jgi:hypothetical protein